MISKPLPNLAKRIGLTGAPGVGKSTFMSNFLAKQNLSQFKIAIIAFDPSSSKTNGALLGDRIRISQNSIFEKVYFRSMATRGAYGGLNTCVESIILFLANCGFNLIFVETVGVGQNEVEIAKYVDQVIHILDPNTGDEIQLEKAGIMEVGDIFFVNIRENHKNDRYISNLRAFVSTSNRNSLVKPEIVIGSAISGEGFEDVLRILELSETCHTPTYGGPEHE
jgi:LAO/AO transport system kinase